LLLGILVIIWHFLYVVHRLRADPATLPTVPDPAGTYSLELNVMALIALGFALSNLLLVILVAPPELRYMIPAGIFLPTVLVVLLFAVGKQVRALPPAVAWMPRALTASLKGIQMEILDSPVAGVGKPGLAWKSSLLLGMIVWCAYMANGREIPNGATVPSKLLPVALLRGDGPFLDRFSQVLLGQAPGEPLPSYLARERGHLVSSYPLGTALVAVPFYLPQVLFFDWLRPEWEKQKVLYYTSRMAKNTAAVLGALTAVAIFQLLRRLGLGRLAWPTALATAVASNLWADSQTLGHQLPAALALTLSVLLLVATPISRRRPSLAGLTTVALVWIHPQDILLAAVIFFWVAWSQPRNLRWFLPLPLLLGGALVGYNYWLFGSLTGGSGDMPGSESLSLWRAPLLEGVAGNLWSPQRGLFVYCPWIVVALATVPAVVSQWRRWSIIPWLLLALVPYLLLCSLNSDWWGGHYFGPRSFTDVLPLFAMLLGFGLAWSWTRFRPVWVAFGVSLTFATGVQLLGAFYYPSSRESAPVTITQTVAAGSSERAWNWHDNELGRLWAEGLGSLKAWAWRLMGCAKEAPDSQAFMMYHPGTLIDLSQDSSAAYLSGAWYGPEEGGQWTGREASVKFRLERPQPLQLRMMVTTLGKQRIIVCINGREVKILQEDGKPDLLQIDLPSDAIVESNTFQLILPDARSRKSAGKGNDDRIVGVAITWIEFVPIRPPIYHPGTRIDFTQASSGVYLHGIWFGPEPERQWSGRFAAVGFRLEHVQPLRLRMMATTWEKQRAVIRFNGREVKTFQGKGESLELIQIDLPRDAIAERNTLQLTLPDAKSPHGMGVGVAWLEFIPLVLIRIDFTQAASGAYLSEGWYGPESWGRWSGRVAGVKFQLERPQPLRLRMLANTFGRQRMVVSFNGREVKTLQGSGGAHELFEVDLPPEAVAKSNTLQLTLPDAKAPSEDPRILGVGVAWMEFESLSGIK
jgi:hypothetical protein